MDELTNELNTYLSSAKAALSRSGSTDSERSVGEIKQESSSAIAGSPGGPPLCLIDGTLYFATVTNTRAVRDDSTTLYITAEEKLTYTPFFADFGPLNLGMTVRFCEMVNEALVRGSGEKKRVVVFVSDNPQMRANTVVLLACYLIIRCGWDAESAWRPFVGLRPALVGFRDAAFGLCSFQLTAQDCVRGMGAAVRCGFFDLDCFDVDKYEEDEKLENGDINWIVPGVFVAFSGPLDSPKQLACGSSTWTPRQYAAYCRAHGVTTVIRLNKACYDRRGFTTAGVRHVDLFYPDGGLPPQSILSRFMDVCERSEGAVAVHCKAGLGRTGSCIGAFCMKHFGLTAREFIAWSRICRPGSVLGPQQQYLERIESEMHREGESFRRSIGLAPTTTPRLYASSLVPARGTVSWPVEAMHATGPLPSFAPGIAKVLAGRHSPSSPTSATRRPPLDPALQAVLDRARPTHRLVAGPDGRVISLVIETSSSSSSSGGGAIDASSAFARSNRSEASTVPTQPRMDSAESSSDLPTPSFGRRAVPLRVQALRTGEATPSMRHRIPSDSDDATTPYSSRPRKISADDADAEGGGASTPSAHQFGRVAVSRTPTGNHLEVHGGTPVAKSHRKLGLATFERDRAETTPSASPKSSKAAHQLGDAPDEATVTA